MKNLDKAFRFLFLTTILLIPFYIFRFSLGPIPSTILEIAIILTFITALLSGRLIRIKNKKALFWAGLFVVAGLVATFFDIDRIAALGLWKAYFVDGFIFFALALSLNQEEQGKAKELLILSGAFTALLAIAFFFGGAKTADGRLLDLDRLSPNYLAMYLVPIFILSLRNIFYTKNKSLFINSLIMGVVMAIAIYMTHSRAGYIASIAGIIVLSSEYLIRKIGKKSAIIAVVSFFILMLAASAWFFRPQANDLGRTGSSSNIRYYIWTTSLEIAKLEPIRGVGLGGFQNAFSSFTKGWVNFDEFITPEAHTAHNIFLHVYLTMGLLGITTFLTLIISSRFWKGLNIALVGALISIFIFGLFDTPFFRNDLAILFWLILALAYYRTDEKGSKQAN